MTRDFDIIVSGAGIAGMVTAAGLARAGFRTCLLDPAPPPDRESAPASDLRSTAYLLPAWRLLEHLGLSADLAEVAQPLAGLRIVDTAGAPPHPRDTRLFTPDDLGTGVFGWNLPNWLTRHRLGQALAGIERLELCLGTGFAGRLARTNEVLVTTDDGTRLRAALLVGADGRNSPVRQAAGIPVSIRRYGQKALAFAVTHDIPHDDISTETYAPGGACTLVPLPDRDGAPASAVVWMQDGPATARLAAADPDDVAAALQQRVCGLLGKMRVVSPVQSWPVVTQTAGRLSARRSVIVAEAAHVLPPIGAQGLNTSLADVASLLETLAGASDPGDPALLAAHDRRRRADVAARAAVIDVFNRVCRSDAAGARRLRAAGLSAVHGIAPLRRAVMRAGMGTAPEV